MSVNLWSRRVCGTAVLGLAACSLWACSRKSDELSLSKKSGELLPDLSKLPVPPADGPKLGSVANVTPVLATPEREAKVIGYLHAGSQVARAATPISTNDCPAGWYPVRPAGFVCVGDGATLDLNHPTLSAMALAPKLDADLPYTYARTRRDAVTYEVAAERDNAVKKVGTAPSRSGMAIVGSWIASDEEGAERRLALMTDGRFLDAGDLEASRAEDFRGVELSAGSTLPVAFVVKKGVRKWALVNDKDEAIKDTELAYHAMLRLEGKSRTVQGERFWALSEGKWVRHKDVTVVRERDEFPTFVNDKRNWLDVSVLTGSAVLYEGRKPVYATLVSVGRDRLGDPSSAEATKRGEFPVVFKHITAAAADPKLFASQVDMYDVPWALELASGQWLHGAFWHDRFGIEHGPGNLQFSTADAARIWRALGPLVPSGWHGVAADKSAEQQSIVNIRK